MRKRRTVTSKRVAEAAGVSQTTVSFVLNNVDTANISEKTRQRVLAVAEQLGYVPDVTARSLARGRSMNIGLVLSRPHPQVFIDEYIPNIITGLSRVMKPHGYRILVELLDDSSGPNAYVQLIRGGEVAGLIVNFASWTESEVQDLVFSTREGFPIVVLEQIHPAVASVTVDKFDGVRRIVNHLINLGHRRIGCITYAPVATQPHVSERLRIYQHTLEEAGIPSDPSLVREGKYDPDTGYNAMKSLLQHSPLPTALYAMNDVMAFGAMTAITEAGLRIPEDIAVVGFDDIRLAAFSRPSLTTVREPDIEHGQRAGEMLLSLIDGKPLPELHIHLETEVIVRDSCGFKLRNP